MKHDGNNNARYKNWPEGSLERSLIRDYPGCKTIQEALNKQLKKAPIVAQSKETVKYHPDYYAMRAIIKEMEVFFEINKESYETLSQETRDRLKGMKVKTLDEAKFWKEHIFFEYKKHMEQTNDNNHRSFIRSESHQKENREEEGNGLG